MHLSLLKFGWGRGLQEVGGVSTHRLVVNINVAPHQ